MDSKSNSFIFDIVRKKNSIKLDLNWTFDIFNKFSLFSCIVQKWEKQKIAVICQSNHPSNVISFSIQRDIYKRCSYF